MHTHLRIFQPISDIKYLPILFAFTRRKLIARTVSYSWQKVCLQFQPCLRKTRYMAKTLFIFAKHWRTDDTARSEHHRRYPHTTDYELIWIKRKNCFCTKQIDFDITKHMCFRLGTWLN